MTILRRNPRNELARHRQPDRASEERIKQISTTKNPTETILVVLDIKNGFPTSHDLDIIGAARIIADRQSYQVTVMAFNADPDVKWQKTGADNIIIDNHNLTGIYSPEKQSAIIINLMEQLQPLSTLMPDTIPGMGDVGRRISAKTGRTLATSVQTVSADGMVASVDAYRQNVKVALEDIMLLNPECALQVSNWSYPPKKIQPSSLPITPERISDQGELDQDMTNLPLELADFIISAGNGLTDWKAFHHLAQRINATIGGTRVVCDNGFLSKSRQVGSSGSLVNARCYLALGIAGAPQHLQGISNCKHVIAINTDLYADMVKRADISIIADVQKIIPALLIQLQKMDKTNADQT